MGLTWYPGGVASRKRGTRSNDMHMYGYTVALSLLLPNASYTCYEVRRCIRCVLDNCCVGRVNVSLCNGCFHHVPCNVVTCRGSISRCCSPATTHTPWLLAQRREVGSISRCCAPATTHTPWLLAQRREVGGRLPLHR